MFSFPFVHFPKMPSQASLAWMSGSDWLKGEPCDHDVIPEVKTGSDVTLACPNRGSSQFKNHHSNKTKMSGTNRFNGGLKYRGGACAWTRVVCQASLQSPKVQNSKQGMSRGENQKKNDSFIKSWSTLDLVVWFQDRSTT